MTFTPPLLAANPHAPFHRRYERDEQQRQRGAQRRQDRHHGGKVEELGGADAHAGQEVADERERQAFDERKREELRPAILTHGDATARSDTAVAFIVGVAATRTLMNHAAWYARQLYDKLALSRRKMFFSRKAMGAAALH